MLLKCQTIFSHHQVRIVNNYTLISSHFDETKFGTEKNIGIVKKIVEQFVSLSITSLKVLKMIIAIRKVNKLKCLEKMKTYLDENVSKSLRESYSYVMSELRRGTSAEKEIAGLHLHFY